MVGCAEGDLVHFDMKDAGLDKLVDKEVDGGAGTIVKNKIVYPAGDEWHEGYVDDIYILGQHGGNPHPLDGCIGNVMEGMGMLMEKKADLISHPLSITWCGRLRDIGLEAQIKYQKGR